MDSETENTPAYQMFQKKKPYLVVALVNGLGNQLFMYAFALAYHQKTGLPVYIDNSRLFSKKIYGGTHRDYEMGVYPLSLPLFDPHRPFRFPVANNYLHKAVRFVYKKMHRIEVREYLSTPYYATDEWKAITIPTLYLGAFQVGSFYLDETLRNSLLKEFTPKEPLSPSSESILQTIRQTPNAVSLHVRRGDYLKYDFRFCILQRDYYEAAITYMQKRIGEPIHLFVFSDDTDKAKDLLQGIPCTFVPNSPGKRVFEDIYLMSQCKHNILANSSYSWWGGYLNDHAQKIVIAPRQWVVPTEENERNEIYCPDWVIL